MTTVPPTLAVRRQLMASFFTSSVVGSRCILYFARGCHRSYCACRFLPAVKQGAAAAGRVALLDAQKQLPPSELRLQDLACKSWTQPYKGLAQAALATWPGAALDAFKTPACHAQQLARHQQPTAAARANLARHQHPWQPLATSSPHLPCTALHPAPNQQQQLPNLCTNYCHSAPIVKRLARHQHAQQHPAPSSSRPHLSCPAPWALAWTADPPSTRGVRRG